MEDLEERSLASRLEDEEQNVLLGAEAVRIGRDQMALGIHRIQQDALWLAAVDNDGSPFRIFDLYLKDLADRCAVSRSALFKYKSAVRIAIVNNLSSEETFIEDGGVSYFNSVQANVAQTDPRTGIITGIKSTDNPDDPVAYTAGVIEQVTPELPPRERIAAFQRIVNPSITTIFFKIVFNGTEGADIKYVIQSPSGIEDGIAFPLSGDLPEAVVSKIMNDLRIGE